MLVSLEYVVFLFSFCFHRVRIVVLPFIVICCGGGGLFWPFCCSAKRSVVMRAYGIHCGPE